MIPIRQEDDSYWKFPIAAGSMPAMDLDPPRLRLLQLVADHDTNLAEVSRAIGRNHAYLQQYVKRGIPRKLPEDVREALADHFGYGVQPNHFKPVPAHVDQKPVAPTSGGEIIEIGGRDYAMIPVFDLRLSAGPGAWLGDDGEPMFCEPHRHDWLRSVTNAPIGSLIIARVDGDSMEPTLRNGDHVLLDLTRSKPSRDGIYGLRWGDDLMVKRISVDMRNGLLSILSDNSAYRTYEDVDPNDVAVIGRVVWLGRQV